MSRVERIKRKTSPTTQAQSFDHQAIDRLDVWARSLNADIAHREAQNPRTYQPLLFTPAELLSCGLRDAHHHPLVGERTAGGGVRSWRTSPEKAWEHPLVEWPRTANSYCSLVLDCDSRESRELALAVVEVGYRRSSTAQHSGAALGFGSCSTRLESANTCSPRGVGASPATCGLRTDHGVLHGQAPGRPGLCWRPVLQPCPRRLPDHLSALRALRPGGTGGAYSRQLAKARACGGPGNRTGAQLPSVRGAVQAGAPMLG